MQCLKGFRRRLARSATMAVIGAAVMVAAFPTVSPATPLQDGQQITLWPKGPPGSAQFPMPQQVLERSKDPAIKDRAVLAITSFRRLWLALGLSSFGDWLGLLATTALAAALPQTPAAKLLAVSGVFILRLAPAVFFGPLAGVVADRLPRRWTLVYGDVLRFVLFCSIPLIGTLWWLYVATVLVEVVGLFWMPAKDATVPNLVPPDRLQQANTLSITTTYGSALPAAAIFVLLSLGTKGLSGSMGWLADAPVTLSLAFNAASFLVSAAVIASLREIPKGAAAGLDEHPSMLAVIRDGWTYVVGRPLVRGQCGPRAGDDIAAEMPQQLGAAVADTTRLALTPRYRHKPTSDAQWGLGPAALREMTKL